VVRARVLDDPYNRGGRFDPYDVVLAGGGLWLVTVVTPDRDGPFSRSLIERLTAELSKS
jgi:hypothetical protein